MRSDQTSDSGDQRIERSTARPSSPDRESPKLEDRSGGGSAERDLDKQTELPKADPAKDKPVDTKVGSAPQAGSLQGSIKTGPGKDPSRDFEGWMKEKLESR